jgi:hypothetical protein
MKSVCHNCISPSDDVPKIQSPAFFNSLIVAEMLETRAVFYETLPAPILQYGSEHQGLRKSLEHNAVSWRRNSTHLR